MNLRQKQKSQTKKDILNSAKHIFSHLGFLQASTLDIAKHAGVAHGTIFSHFSSKNVLLEAVFNKYLWEINQKLSKEINSNLPFSELIEIYLNSVIDDYSFISNIYKFLPFFPKYLKEIIVFKELSIRKYFYDSYVIGVNEGLYLDIEISSLLNFIFGTIQYYIINDEIFSDQDCILVDKKESIILTIGELISK